MTGTRRYIDLSHCRPRQTPTFILELAKLPYLPDAHIDVAHTLELLC